MTSEPAQLQVALVALVLDHAQQSGGAHNASGACRYAPTHDCTFKVAFAAKDKPADADFTDIPVTLVPTAVDPGNPLAPGAIAIVPLSGSPPVVVRVVATPTLKRSIKSAHGKPRADGNLTEVEDTSSELAYFEATGYFTYKGKGVWARHARTAEENETDSSSHFAPPFALSGTNPKPFSYAFICFFLSRVRDRTTKTLRALQKGGATPVEWVPTSTAFKSVRNPPVQNGKVVFSTNPLDLDNDCRVLEVKAFDAPALVAACWPRKNNRQPNPVGFLAAPMEAFVFFHASFGQNAKIYTADPHPFGHSYANYGLHNYLAPGDPLENAYPLSLPYQIATAGKQTVCILPLNRVKWPELANLNPAEQAIELLEEIHAAYLRYAGLYFWVPNLGRLGIASFSAGIQELLRFKRSAASHPLLGSLLQEIYIFDPVHSNGPTVANYAAGLKAWAGQTPQRRVRVYNNQSSPGHGAFVGEKNLPASPFVIDSQDGRFTIGVVSDDDWLRANEGADAFRFLMRTNGFTSKLAKPASSGDTELVLASSKNLRVGDLVVVRGPDVALRVVKLVRNVATLAAPLPSAAQEGSRVFKFDPIQVRTNLAADVAPGATSATLVSGEFLERGDRILIGESEFHDIGSVAGAEVTFIKAVRAAWKKGDSVSKFDPALRTFLSADASAGSASLSVLSGTTAGFRIGDLVLVGRSEDHKLKGMTATTLTLSKPLKQDWTKGRPVEKVEPRKLDWGTYHAMFVSTFVTDAMRKSGFK